MRTGPGGIGKTALATSVAKELRVQGHLKDIIKVDLFAASTPEDVLGALCTGIGISSKVGRGLRVLKTHASLYFGQFAELLSIVLQIIASIAWW